MRSAPFVALPSENGGEVGQSPIINGNFVGLFSLLSSAPLDRVRFGTRIEFFYYGEACGKS